MEKSKAENVSVFISTLKEEFMNRLDEELANSQSAYMRNKFKFIGMKSPTRREVTRPFLLKKYLPEKAQAMAIVKKLWEDDYRDYQLFSMDLLSKYLKSVDKEDIVFFEHLIITKSWWDTVDYIASTLVGNYFKNFPEMKEEVIEKWLNSNNIWLQRTTLIFQLKFKDQLDTSLLTNCIERLNGTKEFFINKAIGWSLRSHSRVDPEWVIEFVDNHKLSNLSRREALKLLS